MDLITGLPKKQGFDAVLVVVDRLSKMVVLIPGRETMSAATVAKHVLRSVVAVHGWPTSIVSDRDPRFTSAFWRSLCAAWGTQQRMGTSFHPQTDGQTERMNRVLEETIRHFVDARQSNWPTCLAMAQFAINNAVSRSTGHSPFFLVHGRHPRIPLHGAQVRPGDDVDAVSFAESLERARQAATRALQVAQDRQRTYANRFRRAVRYHVNDPVLLATKHLSYAPGLARKLMPRFTGPFPIVRVIDKGDETVAVTLRLPPGWKVHPTFHVSRVRPYVPSSAAPPAPPASLTDDVPFELDRIHAHRGRGRQLEYQVQWKGSDLLMWESARKLGESDPVVLAYWRQQHVPPPALSDLVVPSVPLPTERRLTRLAVRQQRLERAVTKRGVSVGSAPAPTVHRPPTPESDAAYSSDEDDSNGWVACPASVIP
jgi:hypothetical protein